MAEVPAAVEMRQIVKLFPGVVANDHVDFTVRKGEIHALLGENGAGKSTLMNVLAGLYRPESGEIRIDGEQASFGSPRDAIEAGIGMLHQHFMLVPTQTVSENLILGQSTPRFLIDLEQLAAEVTELSGKFGMQVDPRDYIWQLSVGEQQRVEILKMLYQGAQILIMDEPTAVLTPQEVDSLFQTLRRMIGVGHTVIFISHKLDEVLEIADRITVLRRGKLAGVVDKQNTDKADLARRMVGREVLFRVEKPPATPGRHVLELRDVSCLNKRGLASLDKLGLQLRSGEILGIAGVAGNGQTALAEVVLGLREVLGGKVLVGGEDLTNRPTVEAIDAGVAYVPADRTGVGSAPNLSCSDNLILKTYRTPPVGRGWAIDGGVVEQLARRLVDSFDIKTPTIDTPARMLSGGNLQKLILARELSGEPDVIVAVYPTRGLDVGATEAVHELLIEERQRGAGVLLISEDLDELLSLADRLAVIYEGRIVGEVEPKDENIERIGLMMAGTTAEAAGEN